MEDEEVVPDNCDLRFYLESLKLYDCEKENIVKQKTRNLPIPIKTRGNAKNKIECIDKDVVEQLKELLSSRMLFEENVNNIERFLSNSKVVKIGMLKSIFESTSGLTVMVLGLCLYWFIGYYVFLMISIYFSYNAADYLWRKHFSQRQLKNLIEILQANYSLLKKSLKFIKDNDNIVKSNFHYDLNYSNGTNHKFGYYSKFKKEFAAAENEIIAVLIKGTKNLIDQIPFYDYVENADYYLCNTYEKSLLECTDVDKLYQIYLLVQSEFLQRLALTLIPNLQVPGKEKYLERSKIIKETSFHLKRLELEFNKKFKFIFLRGIYNSENIFNLDLPKKGLLDLNTQYANEFIANIHNLSNIFQNLLIRSRNIELNFLNMNCPEKTENELEMILSELETCIQNLNENLILLKKLSCKISNSKVNCKYQDFSEEVQIDETNLKIDLTTEEESVEDEIFEADLSYEDEHNIVTSDYDFEDHLKRKAEREYSKLVLEELKTKILKNAKNWEVRQEKVLMKKCDQSSVSSDKKVDCKFESCKETSDNNLGLNESIKFCSNLNERKLETSLCESSKCQENVPPCINTSDFLESIFEARKKVLRSSMKEDRFEDNSN